MNALHTLIFGRKYLDTSLVGKYLLKTNSIDTSGNVFNGSDFGIDYVVLGGVETALFNATSDRIDISDNDKFSFTNGGGIDVPFSISMWVYFTAFSASGNWFINKRGNTILTDEWQCMLYLGTLRFTKIGGSANQGIKTSTNPFSLNTWYNIVCTDNGTKTNAGMKLYVNGVLQTSSNDNSGSYTGMQNGTSITRIGNPAWGIGGGYLNHQGGINNIEIYKNKELNATEVSDIYTNGN